MIGSLIGLQNWKRNLTTKGDRLRGQSENKGTPRGRKGEKKKISLSVFSPLPSFLRVSLCPLWFFFFSFFLCVPLLQAGGAGEAPEQPPTVRVTGVVRLVGSGPGVELLLSTEDREWHIDKNDQDKLRKLQQQTVTVEGEASSQERTFADGRSAGEWFYLRNIKIIDPEKAQ
jgi:hypothetical protein